MPLLDKIKGQRETEKREAKKKTQILYPGWLSFSKIKVAECESRHISRHCNRISFTVESNAALCVLQCVWLCVCLPATENTTTPTTTTKHTCLHKHTHTWCNGFHSTKDFIQLYMDLFQSFFYLTLKWAFTSHFHKVWWWISEEKNIIWVNATLPFPATSRYDCYLLWLCWKWSSPVTNS